MHAEVLTWIVEEELVWLVAARWNQLFSQLLQRDAHTVPMPQSHTPAGTGFLLKSLHERTTTAAWASPAPLNASMDDNGGLSQLPAFNSNRLGRHLEAQAGWAPQRMARRTGCRALRCSYRQLPHNSPAAQRCSPPLRSPYWALVSAADSLQGRR